MKSSDARNLHVGNAEKEAVKRIYVDLAEYGSFDPRADLRSLAAHDIIRRLGSIELFRLLMEPVFHYRVVGQELAVTVFRPIRDMEIGEVYNWLAKFKCPDVDYDEFSDVLYVLDPAKHADWHIHDSDLRGSRLFLTMDRDRAFQEGALGGEEFGLEYVTIPDSLTPADVHRTGFTSQRVKKGDLLIAWGFPTDPTRTWHDHHPKPAESSIEYRLKKTASVDDFRRSPTRFCSAVSKSDKVLYLTGRDDSRQIVAAILPFEFVDAVLYPTLDVTLETISAKGISADNDHYAFRHPESRTAYVVTSHGKPVGVLATLAAAATLQLWGNPAQLWLDLPEWPMATVDLDV